MPTVISGHKTQRHVIYFQWPCGYVYSYERGRRVEI